MRNVHGTLILILSGQSSLRPRVEARGGASQNSCTNFAVKRSGKLGSTCALLASPINEILHPHSMCSRCLEWLAELRKRNIFVAAYWLLQTCCPLLSSGAARSESNGNTARGPLGLVCLPPTLFEQCRRQAGDLLRCSCVCNTSEYLRMQQRHTACVRSLNAHVSVYGEGRSYRTDSTRRSWPQRDPTADKVRGESWTLSIVPGQAEIAGWQLHLRWPPTGFA